MAERNVTDDLYDPRRGGHAIRTHRLRLDGKPSDPARTNDFAVYFSESGSGTVWADASRFAFGPDSLLFFVPYQHVRFVPDQPIHAEVVQFHANFLCVETFHAEVGSRGILSPLCFSSLAGWACSPNSASSRKWHGFSGWHALSRPELGGVGRKSV